MAFINGPVNYIQLNGTINNINKNITIFLDKHYDLDNQTRCESFDSVDISQYLYKLIKETKEKLDFFMEIRDEQIQSPITDKRDIYIRDTIKMFKSEFLISENKVKYSKSNSNVRLHYLDIRDHLGILYTQSIINNKILPELNLLKNNNYSTGEKITKIEEIKKQINLIKNHIQLFLNDKNDISINKPKNINGKNQKYYLNKTINKYINNDLRYNINEFFNIVIIEYMSDFHKTILYEFIIYYKTDYANIYIDKLLKIVASLDIIILKLYTLFTDVYFLRRVLDKNYVRNVITYCGRAHAINYIYFLVKYCKFRITNIYNSNGLSLEEFTNKIKENDELSEVHNLFLIKGEKPKQCVDNISIEDIILL